MPRTNKTRVRPAKQAKPILLTCLYCSKEFIQRRPWDKFCVDRCRFRYHNAKKKELENA